eukprot:4286778-Alexandrium_andersonii.AAC.1
MPIICKCLQGRIHDKTPDVTANNEANLPHAPAPDLDGHTGPAANSQGGNGPAAPETAIRSTGRGHEVENVLPG